MEAKELVLKVLPHAFVHDFANGYMVMATRTARCCLLSGAKSEAKAWERAARMLGLM